MASNLSTHSYFYESKFFAILKITGMIAKHTINKPIASKNPKDCTQVSTLIFNKLIRLSIKIGQYYYKINSRIVPQNSFFLSHNLTFSILYELRVKNYFSFQVKSQLNKNKEYIVEKKARQTRVDPRLTIKLIDPISDSSKYKFRGLSLSLS